MKKMLEFKAKIDTSEMDKQFAQIMQKANQLKSSMDVGMAHQSTAQKLQGTGIGGMTPQSRAEYERFTQKNKRDQDQLIRDQVQANDKIKRSIDDRRKSEESLNKMLNDRIKGSREYLELEQRISRHKENTFRMEQQYLKQNDMISENLQARGGGRRVTGAGIAKAAGGAMAAMGIGGMVGNYVSGLPMGIASAQGNATQGMFGKDLSSLASGNVVGFNAFLPERATALQRAGSRMEKQPIWDFMSGISGVDSVRSMFGGGNGRGNDLVMSALTKGLGSLQGGGMMDQALKAAGGPGAGSGMNKLSESFSNSYQSKLMEDFATNYQSTMDAEVKKNPLKNIAASSLQNNYTRDLAMQRMMGLDYGGYHGAGGFRERSIGAGFTDELGMQAAQGIIGGGGSTRAARGSAVSVLQAQRGFDLTNASGVMGKLSGTLGDSEASNNALKRILAGAFSDGLDGSEFREEQRKYAELTAGAIAASGSTNVGDVENTLRNVRTFLGGDTTMTGMTAAMGAYESSQQTRSQTSGRTGALQFASFLGDPDLGKLSPLEMSGLAELRPEHLTTGNMLVQSAADSIDLTPKQLIDKIQNAKKETEFSTMMMSSGTTKPLFDYMSSNNMTDIPSLESLRKAGASEDVIQSFKTYSANQGMTSGYIGDEKMQRARLRGLGPTAAGTTEEDLAYITAKGESTQTGRIEDQVVQATGVAAQAFLQNFREFKDVITPASEAIGGLTEKLILLAEVASKASESDRAAMIKGAWSQLNNGINSATSPVQPQGGKPKGVNRGQF